MSPQAVALASSLVAVVGSALALAEDSHSLEISAVAPTVTIAPRSRRNNLIRLPALEYVFEVSAECAEPFDAGSLSLTVADSRRSLDAEELAQTGAVRLTVPANQLAPVPVSGFCVGPEERDDDGAATLTLRSALSASASLLCVSDTERKMTYASAGLDVVLVCESGNEAGE